MKVLDFVISEKNLGNTASTPQNSETKKKKIPVVAVYLQILFKILLGMHACMWPGTQIF